MTNPVLHKSRMPHWRWLLAAMLLIVVAVLGIRLLVLRANQFYRITGFLRQRGVIVIEGRPDWMHSLGMNTKRFNYPYTDGLQLDFCTDLDVQTVAEMTHLEFLRLDSTAVTDDGLIWIRPLKNLTTLVLASNSITDAGLQNLKGLGDLENLYLEFVPITDAGLESLHGLTRLRQLSLEGTKVTPAGIGKLKAALPAVTVFLKP
jgi:hypothetical protein